MAIKVKDIAKSAGKWSRNAGGAATEYKDNALAAADDWARNAAAAADNFLAGVTAAGVKERFRSGVSRAGAAKFRRKVEALGDRFSSGIAAAETDYASGAAPFYETLAAISLPHRRPRGDPGNYQRSQAVGSALHAKRLALLGTRS